MTIYDDLLAAGLPVVDAEPGVTPHFSRPLTVQEEMIRDSIMNMPVYRLNQAKLFAKNIPNYATWTQAQWANHFDNNLDQGEIDLVTSLATARVMIARQNAVIDGLVKVVIALRDIVLPDNPD